MATAEHVSDAHTEAGGPADRAGTRRRRARPGALAHLSVGEPNRAREGGAGSGAALQPRRMGTRGRSARSGRAARGAGRIARAGARARSATAGCWCRRSRSSAAPRTRWRPTSPATPRTGLEVQLCGDAHLSNFGGFAAPDRRLVFSINDFDETLPGPFEWDVKRLVASFAVAGRDRGFDAKQRAVDQPGGDALVPGGDAAPSPAMCNLDLWYARIDVDEIAALALEQGSRKAAEAVRAQPRQGAVEGQPEGLRRSSPRSSTASRGSSSDPPLIVPIEDVAAGAERAEIEEFVRERHPLLPTDADRRPPAAARAVPLRRTRRARSSAWAASARAPGSC